MSESLDTPPPVGPRDPAAVLAQVRAEAALRRQRGEKPDVEGYCRRFPPLASTIRACLAEGHAEGDDIPPTASSSPWRPAPEWRP
jgi:hypothetical protein